MPRTVVIVDDHAPFRASARRLLETEGYEVVGEAADAASAVETVLELRPDLVLLDVVLPDGSGFDVAERLAGAESKVVLVSSHDRSDLGSRLRRTNAAGFIPKDELSAETLAEVV
jgi:DNA-binding NarL/FixJ family response regulator